VVIRIFALMLLGGRIAPSQSDISGLTFDAASVKQSGALARDRNGHVFLRAPSGGPGPNSPGRISYPHMTLKALLKEAFELQDSQILGPFWLSTSQFDVEATLAPQTTREQFRVMLQNLLKARFNMKIHSETKELLFYSLTVAKNGPKLAESTRPRSPSEASADNPASSDAPPSPPRVGEDGFPILPPPSKGPVGFDALIMKDRARLIGRGQTMQDLARRLALLLGKPVFDSTALIARYDFTLTFSPEGTDWGEGPLPAPPDGESPPGIIAAIRSQLGLRLQQSKGPVDVLVIDHADRTPVAN
jgi:uncharacterized protein (TIGR03435 family)